jgi:hypothetical protein
MYIAFDHPRLTSSGGATYECLYVAPPELARCGGTSSIYIPRLWRSGPMTLISMIFYLLTLHINISRANWMRSVLTHRPVAGEPPRQTCPLSVAYFYLADDTQKLMPVVGR